MSNSDPYSGDILGGHSRNSVPSYPQVPAKPGTVVESRLDGYVGAVVGFERTYDGDFIHLEDRKRKVRPYKLRDGAFLIDGQIVTLTRFVPPKVPERSNSGSRKIQNLKAKIAVPSRIWVEGIHDAAIVEKVWGHDLRVEGVVVEYLEGLDNLPARLAEFRPEPQRRVGVLADHLVTGSKESHLTEALGPNVAVTGHPYIDIWAAVKPERLGIFSWPDIPRGQDWKTGVCQQLGWGGPREGWNRVYRAVNDYRDLDYTLLGAVEKLIDFVTNHQLSKEDALG